MKAKIFAAVLILALALVARADSQWALEQSTLTYHVDHPLHQVAGTSHQARGKGVCHNGQCEFLIAVPVKSFDSGDSNRDLHMLEVTRGAQFPLISVRTTVPETATASGRVQADLEVQFAGQTADYKNVQFKETEQGGTVHISGTIPAKCSDFKITPPALLMIPIKDGIPVDVDMTWQKQP